MAGTILEQARARIEEVRVRSMERIGTMRGGSGGMLQQGMLQQGSIRKRLEELPMLKRVRERGILKGLGTTEGKGNEPVVTEKVQSSGFIQAPAKEWKRPGEPSLF